MTLFPRLVRTLTLAGLTLAGTATALAQTSLAASAARGGAMRASAPSSADRQFVTEAAKGGMAEVALGQLAQQKGGSDAVKRFGSQMVDDHSKANDELKQLADAKGIAFPANASKDSKAAKLETMSGVAFDRAYMSQMLVDHKKTVALFQKEAESRTGDSELKAFAAKTLPVVQSHLRMVQSAKHSSSSGTDGGASVTQH